jgi:hypothetical protein
MALQQVRFLGASVTGFTANLGWASQESRLQVGLVDDTRYGDFFNPPDVGAPVYFNYMGWQFNGLLENYQTENNFSGNPTYSLSVVDPRVLLDGVQIILSDYYGPVSGIPNLLNIFGYYENLGGFGSSGKNESGIEWGKISAAITLLTMSETSSLYGGPISYKGHTYNINLSNLPVLPLFYRVSASPNMSLMDYINEICEAGACEYFVTLIGSTININTISRFNIPLKGQITAYVNNTFGATSKSNGLQMVNETCSKFLVGGAKTDVFFNFFGTGSDNSITSSVDNPIWYYWGKDLDGNLIVSDGPNQNFILDARSVLVANVPNNYPTDLEEMKAALAGQDAWETFIWFNTFNEYIFDATGNQEDPIYIIDGSNRFVVTTTKYKHNGDYNPHFRKAYDLKMDAMYDKNIVLFLLGASPNDILNKNLIELMNFHAIDLGVKKDYINDIEKLYSLLNAYAEEHYGRKFMVTVPDVFVKQDSDTGELSFSHKVIDSGYLAENVWEDAIANNLMPPTVNEITTVDGKITAYVRFDNIQYLDLSGMEPKDLIFGVGLNRGGNGTRFDGVTSIFIRCQIDDDYVFINNNFDSPRVVITLTSRIYQKYQDKFSERIIFEFLNKVAANNNWTANQTDSISKKLYSSTIADLFAVTRFANAAIPNMAAIPLQSNTETYGPWYATGANGKIEVEHSEDLVPWNYGGYTNMNITGQSRVSLAVGNLQWLESGTIEYPGVPDTNLGSQLLGSGPYVTDISMAIGQDKVTTTYKMSSWNPKYGKVQKSFLDKMQKVNKLSQQIRRNMREQLQINTAKSKYFDVKSSIPGLQ